MPFIECTTNRIQTRGKIMEKQAETKAIVDRSSLILLGISIVLLFFYNGLYTVYLATWLAPVFFIRFLRSQKMVVGLLIGLLINVVVTIITWRGMIPVPGALIIVVGGMIGVISFMPYLIDRLLWRNSPGFSATLVFPCAWVGFEYMNSLFNPYATWGSLAYTQFDGPLAFLQLISVTGIWGPVFIITWFASLVNWIWENNFTWIDIKKGVGIYVGLMIAVFLFGGARLSLLSPASETVRIASIVSPFEWVLKDNTTDPAVLEALRKSTLSVQGELLLLSKQAALGDADIVFWSEAAAPVFERDEKSFIKKASKLSSDLGVYLMLSLYVRPQNYPQQQMQNKVLMLDTEGEITFQYLKSKPVPGNNITGGKNRIGFVETPFGRVGSVICFDMDFPGLIRQAGKNDIDVMLVPAGDWKEINPIHTYMASMRSIENGFSMVRSTKDGLSAAFDYQGRLLNAMDEFTTGKKIMFSDVPAKSTETLYSIIGDFFAWLSMLGLTALIILAFVKRKETG